MTGKTLANGLLAGLAGVAAMTLAEKVEQLITRRPDSYVPAHTLERLLGLPHKPDEERLALNWTMHWGQGILMGVVRGIMAEKGLRGPVGSFMFMNLRLLNDQTLENATGVGRPALDVAPRRTGDRPSAQGIYAFAAGLVADRLIEGPAPPTRPPERLDGWGKSVKKS
jgi:hypothetical protein